MPAPSPVATDLAGLARLRGQARTDAAAALPETARQFESLFTQMMLKSMRAVSFGDDLTGNAGGLYRDLLDQQLAVHLSAGKGLGLAEMMVRQMQRRESAQESTDTAVKTSVPPNPIAAESTPRSRSDFVSALWPHAQTAAQKLGVSPRVLVAQAALETGWGQHQPKHADGSPSHNLFGVKAGPEWDGERVHTRTHEYEDGAWTSRTASFRAYDSLASGLDDYVRFLQSNPRYAEALAQTADAPRFTQALQDAGYATDPDYAGKIQRVLDSDALQTAYGLRPTGTQRGNF